MDLFLFLKKQLMFNTDFLQKEKEDDRRGYSSKQADKLFFGLYIYIYIYTHTHTHTHIHIYIYIYIILGFWIEELET